MERNERIQQYLVKLVASESTESLSAQMGHRNDVVGRWIAGSRRPSTSAVFELMGLVGLDPYASLAEHMAIGAIPPEARIRHALRTAAEDRPMVEIAAAVGVSRHVVRRALSGEGRIAFDTFVGILEASYRDPLAWFGAKPTLPVSWRDPAEAAQIALSGLDTGLVRVTGNTTGVDARKLPQLRSDVSAVFEEALHRLPLRVDGRRRIQVALHIARIDGHPLHQPPWPPTPPHVEIPDHMDARQLSSEFVRAVRGTRSQRAMSMRMGFSTNVVYRWESGRAEPAAADVFTFLARTGVDVTGHLRLWALNLNLTGDIESDLAAIVDNQCRSVSIHLIAHRTGIDRHRLGRLRRGQQRMKLNEFFVIGLAATGRLLDLLGAFVPLDSLPSITHLVTRQEARRELTRSCPGVGRVLLALRHAAWLRSTGELDLLAALSGFEVHTLPAVLEQLQRAAIVEHSASGWRVRRHISMSHNDTPAQAREFARELLTWAAHEDHATGHAVEVTIDQADMRPIMQTLSAAILLPRRCLPESSNAPDAAVAVVAQITPLDGQPLQVGP